MAIDADPATNLNLALGVQVEESVGKIREDMSEAVSKGILSPSISKQEYLDSKIMAALVESKGFDLLAVGRPEGPGCYCAANNMLRLSIDKLGKNYAYVVIDSEAGLEHISRQTTRDVDFLVIVSDLTQRGVKTAGEIKRLIREMRTQVGRICLVINRTSGDIPVEINNLIEQIGFEQLIAIGQDPNLSDLEVRGVPATQLPDGSPLRAGIAELARGIGG